MRWNRTFINRDIIKYIGVEERQPSKALQAAHPMIVGKSDPTQYCQHLPLKVEKLTLLFWEWEIGRDGWRCIKVNDMDMQKSKGTYYIKIIGLINKSQNKKKCL